MITYQDLLLPFGVKEKKGKKYAKCPFCKNGTLNINSNVFFCSKCGFRGSERDFLKKLNIKTTSDVIVSNTHPQVKINNPERPIFLVFDSELFKYLSDKFSNINLILNPIVSMKEVQNKILYICSEKQNIEYADIFFASAKLLKILNYDELFKCNTEEQLKELVLKSSFYDPYPINGLIISDDKKIVDYINKLKYTAVLAKTVSPSIIEENCNVFFLYKTATIYDIAKVINPLFQKTQNIFLFSAENITVNVFTDILSEKQKFTVQFKKIVYQTYEKIIINSDIFKKIPPNIFEQTMNEFYGCKKLIENMEFNSFLNLVLSKYDFLIKNIPWGKIEMSYLNIYEKYVGSIKKIGKSYMALCPFHPDTNPSMKIDPEKGFFYCFGCNVKGKLNNFLDKLKAECGVEVDKEDYENSKTNKKGFIKKEPINYDEVYTNKTYYSYVDLNGNLAYIKIRYDTPKENSPDVRPKTFVIEFHTQDKRLFFYNLQGLNYIKDEDKKNYEIWFAEGEKCVDVIERVLDSEPEEEYPCIVLGYNNPEREWEYLPESYKAIFKDRDIKIFVDNDEIGQKKALQLIEILKKYAKKISLIQFSDKPSGYDIADFLEEGNPIFDALAISNTVYEVRKFSGNVLDILEYEVPEQKYVLQDNLHIPTGILSIIAGSGGLGKSYLSLYFALELMAEGKNVSMITLEDPIEKIIERIQRLLRKYQKTIDKSVKFTVYEYQEQDLLELTKNILENESDVLFIDPIGSVFEDENDNAETSRFMRKLAQIAISTKKNIFLVHHIRKMMQKPKEKETTKEDLYDMVRGASAIPNTAKHVVYVRRWKEDKNVLEVITVKHNYHRTDIDLRVKNLFDRNVPVEIEKFEFEKKIERPTKELVESEVVAKNIDEQDKDFSLSKRKESKNGRRDKQL